MDKILQIVEIVLACLLIISVLMQQRGSGLGGAFGSETAAYHARRGFEKFLYFATIAIGIAFILVALASVMVAVRQL